MPLTITGIDKLAKRLENVADTRKYLGAVGIDAVAEAKARVPRRTGNLGRTIRLGSVTKEAVEVHAGGRLGVGYAAAVEFGSRAHEIVPVRRKALAWGGARTLGGRLKSGARPTHFARRVRHPGTRAQPYLLPGMLFAVQRAGGKFIVKQWNDGA